MSQPDRDASLPRAPILLVDDNAANLLALEAVLGSPDYDLVAVPSGQDALEELRRSDFAVVLLDVQMPVMDGIETALKMRPIAADLGRNAPIIFLTGIDADRSRVLRGYASGAVDFVQKPFEPQIIRSKVAVFVELYRAKERLLTEIAVSRRLQETVRARDELLSVVAHDLRNPLNVVAMSAGLLRSGLDKGAPVTTKKALQSIDRALERMKRLTDDLLDLSRLEAGQPLPIAVATHDLRDLAQETADLLEPLASARRIVLETDLHATAYALCDGDRVRQVLSNLIGNAIKFTPEGGSVRVATRSEDEEVVLSVRDTGVGIPRDHVAHLFERFWRADPKQRQGAGLGLAIVKAIVEAHRGRVWVQAEEGAGSTFFVALPADRGSLQVAQSSA